jgi:hypothetical protein
VKHPLLPAQAYRDYEQLTSAVLALAGFRGDDFEDGIVQLKRETRIAREEISKGRKRIKELRRMLLNYHGM